MKPAIKAARINGLQTIIANLKEGYSISNDLKAHSDLIRTISFQEIIDNLRTQKQPQAIQVL